MTQDFPGVEVDIEEAGDYEAKVDAKIQRIKETYKGKEAWATLETTSSASA
jgi:hypothetical protein